MSRANVHFKTKCPWRLGIHESRRVRVSTRSKPLARPSHHASEKRCLFLRASAPPPIPHPNTQNHLIIPFSPLSTTFASTPPTVSRSTFNTSLPLLRAARWHHRKKTADCSNPPPIPADVLVGPSTRTLDPGDHLERSRASTASRRKLPKPTTRILPSAILRMPSRGGRGLGPDIMEDLCRAWNCLPCQGVLGRARRWR